MMKKIFTCFFAIIATTAVAGDNDWYVVGNSEIVNVNDKSNIPFRDCSDDNRMITLDNEHYVLIVENKSLEADVTYNYTFKTGNGVDYCPAHDPNNYAKLTVNETGTYDITYTFNINTRKYGVELVKKGPANIVYSVAGDNVALFGGNGTWDYENEDTEMTNVGGYGIYKWNYTWTSKKTHFEALTLIKFRVYRNHDKEIFYGNTEYQSNRKWGDRGYECEYLILEEGDYVLTFIFNANDRTIKVDEGEPYYLRGDVNEWKIDDDYKFTRVFNEDYRSIYLLELKELSGNFKFAVNGEWGNDQYGLNSTYNISNGYVFELQHDQNAQNISLGEPINDVIIMFSNRNPYNNPPKARVSQVYALKHKGWGDNPNDWDWKVLTKRSDDIWSVVAPYNGGNVDYSNGINEDDLGVYRKLKVVGDPKSLEGKECEFVFIPSTKEIIVGAKQSQEVKISIDGGNLQPMTSFGDGTYRLMGYYYLDNVKIQINGVYTTSFTTKADAGLIPGEPCSYIFIPRNNGQNELYIQRGVITRINDVEVSGYDSFEGSKAVKMIENGRIVIVKDGKKFNVMGQAIK